ncbi:3606_t:CDS:2, partial [Funneliformis caledonium]
MLDVVNSFLAPKEWYFLPPIKTEFRHDTGGFNRNSFSPNSRIVASTFLSIYLK